MHRRLRAFALVLLAFDAGYVVAYSAVRYRQRDVVHTPAHRPARRMPPRVQVRWHVGDSLIIVLPAPKEVEFNVNSTWVQL